MISGINHQHAHTHTNLTHIHTVTHMCMHTHTTTHIQRVCTHTQNCTPQVSCINLCSKYPVKLRSSLLITQINYVSCLKHSKFEREEASPTPPTISPDRAVLHAVTAQHRRLGQWVLLARISPAFALAAALLQRAPPHTATVRMPHEWCPQKCSMWLPLTVSERAGWARAAVTLILCLLWVLAIGWLF